VTVREDPSRGEELLPAYDRALLPSLGAIPQWQELSAQANIAIVFASTSHQAGVGLATAVVDLGANGQVSQPISVRWLAETVESTVVRIDSRLLFEAAAGAVTLNFVEQMPALSIPEFSDDVRDCTVFGKVTLTSEHSSREVVVTRSMLPRVRIEGLPLGEIGLSFVGEVPGLRYPKRGGEYLLVNVTNDEQIIDIPLPSNYGAVSFELLGENVDEYRSGLIVMIAERGGVVRLEDGTTRTSAPCFLKFSRYPYGPTRLLTGEYDCLVYNVLPGTQPAEIVPLVIGEGESTECVLTLGALSIRPF
jgi:hypothetical protein